MGLLQEFQDQDGYRSVRVDGCCRHYLHYGIVPAMAMVTVVIFDIFDHRYVRT
jgi:hypothetical protein